MTSPRPTLLLLALFLLSATIGLAGCKPSVGRMISRGVLTQQARERAKKRYERRPRVRPVSDDRVSQRHRASTSKRSRGARRSR